MYHTIRAELLPTPAKSHYTYNMRDLSKVFQGLQVRSGLGPGSAGAVGQHQPEGCCLQGQAEGWLPYTL